MNIFSDIKNNGSKVHHPTLCFSNPPLFRLPLCCPTFSSSCLFTFPHKLTSFLSSLFLKPVRSSCCGRGGSGVKLFPPRARRRACSLDEQAAAWSQSSQVSALRGEQFCGAQKKVLGELKDDLAVRCKYRHKEEGNSSQECEPGAGTCSECMIFCFVLSVFSLVSFQKHGYVFSLLLIIWFPELQMHSAVCF